MDVLQYGSAVVTLVGHHLFDVPKWIFGSSALAVATSCWINFVARICQSLVNRCRVALIAPCRVTTSRAPLDKSTTCSAL